MGKNRDISDRSGKIRFLTEYELHELIINQNRIFEDYHPGVENRYSFDVRMNIKEKCNTYQEYQECAQNSNPDMFDYVSVGYVISTRAGIIEHVDNTTAGILELERADLLKKPFSEFISHDSKDIFLVHMLEVFQSNHLKTCMIKLVKKDGTEIPARLESVPIQDKNGCFTQCTSAIIFMEENGGILT